MYYTDITNPELTFFQNKKVHNFTAKLTDILTSDLFAVEQMTSNIYKIIPLFYTGEITSSNGNDRVLDNKIIICEQTSNETFITFKSYDDEDFVDFTEYGQYYGLGDKLTTEQFNGYISLLRQNVKHSEEIIINEIVTGQYGEYLFDIDGATVIDTGFIVSDETISAEPRVKLTSNVFGSSKYILELTVLHFTGANIMDGDNTDFKVVDVLEIELIPNRWVDIPVADLQKDYIISLNGNVRIEHNIPVIQDYPQVIDLTMDKSIIQVDEVVDLIATVKDSVKPLSNVPVYFYEVYEPTLLKLTGDKSIMQTGDVLDLKATLKDEDGSLVEDEEIYFYIKTDLIIDDPTEQTQNGGSGLKILHSLSNLGNKWKLSCQLKTSCESRLFIGDANNTDTNPQNSVFVGSPNGSNRAYYGYRTTSTSARDITNYDVTSYTEMSIERNGDTFVCTLNGTSYMINNLTWFNYTDLVVGLVAWGSSGAIYIKDLKLEAE